MLQDRYDRLKLPEKFQLLTGTSDVMNSQKVNLEFLIDESTTGTGGKFVQIQLLIRINGKLPYKLGNSRFSLAIGKISAFFKVSFPVEPNFGFLMPYVIFIEFLFMILLSYTPSST